MTLQANSSGVVTGKFTVPANVPSGSKLVAFAGSGGSRAEATFIGQGETVIDTKQVVTTVTTTRRQVNVDPLAETFSLDAGQQITGVDLWFTAKSANANDPVWVELRETSLGFPTQTILASKRLLTSAINVNGSPTRFNFDAPIRLEASTEYALVVLANDATTACSIAELGKWDSVAGRWVTAQPYQVGVMLSSSNARSWTAHQDRDLAFRLVKASFTQSTKTVSLGSVAVSGATDLIVRANVENPSSRTNCTFRLTLPDASTLTVAAEQPVRLAAAITGNVQVEAILSGNSEESPVLHRDVFLLHGTVSTTCEYVSRAITGGTNVKTKVILEALLPGTASVAVQAKGVDAGDTWAALTSTGSVQLGDGWVELSFESASMTETMIQSKLILSGTSQWRPQVRNLRMLVA